MQFGRVRDPGLVDFALPALSERSRALLKRAASTRPPVTDTMWLCLGAPVFRHRDWIGTLYASDSDPEEQLQVYASKLGALELNSTFYGLPSEATLERWIAQTPEDFRFCPKIPRAISHQLHAPELPQLAAAFVRRMGRLGTRLGPALMQLPESFAPEALALLDAALAAFPDGLALAVEVRHTAWFQAGVLRDELLALFERRGVASVITDVAGRRDVCHGSLSQPLAFVRFVGEGGHPSDEPRVASWIARLAEWRSAGLNSAFFFIHQPDDGVAPQLLSSCAELARASGIEVPRVQLETTSKGQLDLFG